MFVLGQYFQINKFSGLLNRQSAQERKLVPALFVRISKISGLWEPRYCKRGYFRWGKISRKCWQNISRGGNFHDTTHISFKKAYGFYFRVGVIFAKMTKARKTRKLPPRENFHVYSKRIITVCAGLLFSKTLH